MQGIMGYKSKPPHSLFVSPKPRDRIKREMRGLRCYYLLYDDEFRLELTPTTSPLSIDAFEPTHTRIQRLINDNPIIVFSRPECFMCDVMKRLFYSIGVHPIVIELEEEEITELETFHHDGGGGGEDVAPSVFIGGNCIGGLESLVALHLSGHLVAKLVEIGALEDVVL